ncbi:MAG: acyl carrier protein [Phycisphaerae bacterium]|nr:acyl carrier protein [Phycisphaerae bacterium]
MNHDRNSITAKVCQLAAAQVAADPATVGPATNFAADLNFDSLDMVDFTMNLEDAFEIAVSDERANEVKTVGEAIELVLAALPARNAAPSHA